MKFIVDQKSHPCIYYDGDSMGMGGLSVTCICGQSYPISTKKIIQNHREQSNSDIVSDFEINAAKNHRAKFSFFKCEYCKKDLLLAITCGEVQSGRYQASYAFLAEC